MIIRVLLLLLMAATSLPAQSISRQYGPATERLVRGAISDSAAWQRLVELTDRFGPRFSGSDNLERAIDWIIERMKEDGLENVRGEPVMVPHWVRGRESAELLEPRRVTLPMLGLGGSIGTPPEGIAAEVLVVSSFDELTRRAREARGKIVLFNARFENYGATVQYRYLGAQAAARAGAVASLISSVASFSMKTPHTGLMAPYDSTLPRIPHAAITVEDAQMLQRMQQRGQRVVVKLMMEAQTLPDVQSRNVVAELRGRERPDEVIILGGHIDSWDVGTGAMDDAGGCIAAWQAVKLMKQLGLRPRRTVRVVLWTNEENGLRGGTGYRDAHRAELDRHVLAIESDAGVFKPLGFGVTASDSAFALIRQIKPLLDRIGAGEITRGGGGADIGPIMALGVPGAGLNVQGDKYFWYHHSDADTVDKLDPHELNLSTAALAILAYVVADLPDSLPRQAAASR